MDNFFSSTASSSKRPLLSSLPHELPRWRMPSPMTASIIPRPIVQSSHNVPSPPSALARSVIIDPPSPLQDRQSELEADLQFLLDAQAEGLVKGLGDGLQDDQTSNGSTTPTAQSVRSGPTRQQRRLLQRKPGLRSARKGIYNAMLALSSLKENELAEVNVDVQEAEQKLGQINEWEKKRDGLHEATRSVDADEEAIRAQRLRQEATVLQQEINSVELQLHDLKARHRKLLTQAVAVENSVQAKVASYTSSLRLLEEDVRKFLSLDLPRNNVHTTPSDGRTSMWQLPPKRRTLEMAKEQWTDERRSTLQHRESVEHEKAALDEGAAIWKDIVGQITEFERHLRSAVMEISATSPALGNAPTDEQPQKLAALIESIRQLIQSLESSFELAKDRNWNLLIAAIGAELDALRKGRHMLETALNLGQEPAGDDESVGNRGEEIHDLDKSFANATPGMHNDIDSDPDPDPELMFSKHGIDTD